MMYTLRDYGDMIADRERFQAYSEALCNALRPNDVVLEIGCGPGLLALMAGRAGARKVYAIESEEIVHHARDLAIANGLADRVEFLHGDSRNLRIPEPANIIISDLRGSLPFFDHAVTAVEDARQRFLAPGGIMIPRRDLLKAAIVDATEYYSHLTSPWRGSASGIDLSRSLALVLNECYTTYFKTGQLLTEPRSWCVLDYQAGAAANAAGDLCFQTVSAGTAHGVCMWFETELADGIGFSTGPSDRRGVYGQRFFPWLQAVSVEAGQKIHVSLRADLVGDEYVWQWETRICGSDSIARHFQQSTFQGANFTPESLRRRAADFVPSLSEEGQADRWLLQAMDGKTSLQQMAQAAAQRFPAIFPRWEKALHRAAELARQFSR
jgi:type I protein arginine methyltransferase